MRYAIFEKSTGRIDRIIVAPTGVASASASCAPGEDFVAANAGETDASHYVQGFSLVAMPARPGEAFDWDWMARRWVENANRAWAQVRRKRNALLSESDWTQLPDAPLTAAEKTAWTAYREQLRSITNQPDPLAITWPKEPA